MAKERNARAKKGKDTANQGVVQHSVCAQEGEQVSRSNKKKDKPSASQALLQQQPSPPFPVKRAPHSKDSSLAILQRSPPQNDGDSSKGKDEVSSQSSEEAVLMFDPPKVKGNKKTVEGKPDTSPGKIGSPLEDLASKEGSPEQKSTPTSDLMEDILDTRYARGW
jgi:hypothetical protein